MPEAIEHERRAVRRLITRRLGVPDVERVTVDGVQLTGAEADFLRLPVDSTATQPLQDPTTGAPYFLLGISPLGGANDALAPEP